MTSLTLLSALVVLGAHAVVPWHLASRHQEAPRNRWRLAALPLLGLLVLAGLAWMASHPDHLLGVDWGQAGLTRIAAHSATLTLGALTLVDLVPLVNWRWLEPAAWRLTGLFALLPLAAVTLLQEILRVGPGPRTTAGALALAVVIHGVLALAAGEALAPARTGGAGGRPWLSLAAGLTLPFYPLALPPPVRVRLLEGGEGWTLLAAVVVFLGTPWLLPRLRRAAILAASLLATLVLARAVDLAISFPVWMDSVLAL